MPSLIPLWYIKHDKVPSTVAQFATKFDKVSYRELFQWRKCAKVP